MTKLLFGGEQLMVFSLIGKTTFCVEIHDVVSIIESDKIRKIPLAPIYLNSVVNYQGQIVTLFDLKVYFGEQSSVFSREKKIICLKHKKLQIGLIVDKITGIKYVLPSCIEPVPEEKNGCKKVDFCQGLIVMDEDSPGINWLETKKIGEFISSMEIQL